MAGGAEESLPARRGRTVSSAARWTAFRFRSTRDAHCRLVIGSAQVAEQLRALVFAEAGVACDEIRRRVEVEDLAAVEAVDDDVSPPPSPALPSSRCAGAFSPTISQSRRPHVSAYTRSNRSERRSALGTLGGRVARVVVGFVS